jgi:hypothetical protein
MDDRAEGHAQELEAATVEPWAPALARRRQPHITPP